MKKRILLIGDTIIDRYHYLDPVGLSLESPTLKCNKISSYDEYGGAANVARMLQNLNCDVHFFTSIDSSSLVDLQKDINCSVFQASNVSQTKERFFITKGETYKYLQINDCKKVSNANLSLDPKEYDAIVISDYRLGIVQKDILKSLPKDKTICQMQISDSNDTLEKFKGFHVIVGNKDEIPKEKIEKLSHDLNIKVCVSTNEDKEVTAFEKDQGIVNILPEKINNVKNYHGAGDAFFAGFCSFYDFNIKNIIDSVIAGNRAAKNYLLRQQNVK